jgi:hypothetical protein
MGIAMSVGAARGNAEVTPAMLSSQAAGPTVSMIATSTDASQNAHARTPVGPDPGEGFVRLPGHVLDVASASPSVEFESSRVPLTLSLVLRRDDTAGYEQYLKDVYDPKSGSYLHFLTQQQLTHQFGPSRGTYAALARYLRSQGLKVLKTSPNRLTLTVRGSRQSVETAFRLGFRGIHLHEADYFVNDADPALPDALAPHVLAVDGLSSLSSPQPVFKSYIYQNVCGGTAGGGNGGSVAVKNCVDATNQYYAAYHTFICGIGTGDLAAPTLFIETYGGTALFTIAIACALSDIFDELNGVPVTLPGGGPSGAAQTRAKSTGKSALPTSVAFDGTGQTIGLVEFDAYNASDVSNYLSYVGASTANIANLSTRSVNGGVATPGAGETEVLLDIEAALTLAPGAKVAVYEAPFNGGASSYTSVFNAMITDGVTVISNSWASCEDQVSEAEAQSIDAVLQAAAASGISVFNGTGDTGSTCLDGSPNTISVPADSPNATAVGGTSWAQGLGPGRTYGVESWWDGSGAIPSTGQSGFGTSRYFAQPAYQSGLTTGNARSIPDVVARADPANGVIVCQADAGGCPTGTLNGGTSLAAPEWAAVAALLNQREGKNLGAMNPQLYALAQTAGFHNAASMGSDFQHVGLGSPNINVLGRLLHGDSAPGIPSANVSLALPLIQPATNTVHSDGTFTVPADGTSQGGVLVRLYDAAGNSVDGKTVTLTASAGHAVITPASGVSSVSNGTVSFLITDTTAEVITVTATDTTDGVTLAPLSLTFAVPSAASAGISATPLTLPPDGSTAATVTVTLKDSLHRPTAGKSVSLSDAGAHATITGPTPAVTDANGQIQFQATDTVNETVVFTAVDATDGNLPVPGSATVTYSGTASAVCGIGTAPVASTGYAITPFATGVQAASTVNIPPGSGGAVSVNVGCPGAGNPVFTPDGAALIADFDTGALYRIGLAGGTVSSSNVIANLGASLANLVYGKDGNLYGSQGAAGASIFQLNPTTGAVIRTVASNLTCPTGLAVDPLSGDLFFSDFCTGAGTDDPSIYRIVDPANSDPSRPTSVVPYATLPTTPNGTLAFAPNGTLYAASGYGAQNATIQQVSGTNSATITVTPLSGITTDFGVAIGATNADGSAQSLIVEPSGTLTEVPIANPANATVLATGGPGVGAPGPDGCLYSGNHDTVQRLTASNGTCPFAQTTQAASLILSPSSVSPSPEQGTQQTFTATVRNVSTLSGIPVSFAIGGANAQTLLARTNANGAATVSYPGAVAGADVVTAIANTTTGTSLRSNSVNLTWAAGRDLTFMTLNLSPQGGQVNVPVTIVASLSDVTQSPITAVAGQTVTMTLGSSSCSATTNANGVASCAVTPTQGGTAKLSASFGGNSQLTTAAATAAFSVSAPATPAPTVTLNVSPATIATGSTASLTWSSTNATSCTAGGAWSGAQATTGTTTVTANASGRYSYTLTCTGVGGSATATAVLSATLVAVTVTAKSGGGAISWYTVLFLLALATLRRHPLLARCTAARLRGLGLLAVVTLPAAFAQVDSARAQSAGDSTGSSPSLESYYVGVRVGSMQQRQDAGRIDQGLADRGFTNLNAATQTAGAAGTVFVGYEFTPHTAVELGYTLHEATAARVSGNIASTATLTSLLQDTTGLLRGYGNIVSLSYAGRFELAPRFILEPRLGGFFWATKVSAISLDDRIDATHEGSGITAGLTAAYRVWRAMELGVSIDHYHGFPSNLATMYAGTIEWRFGR